MAQVGTSDYRDGEVDDGAKVQQIPTNAEDAVAMALDEALTEGGYRGVAFQPYANELVAAAVEALWMDDATLAQAARSALDRHKDRLLAV